MGVWNMHHLQLATKHVNCGLVLLFNVWLFGRYCLIHCVLSLLSVYGKYVRKRLFLFQKHPRRPFLPLYFCLGLVTISTIFLRSDCVWGRLNGSFPRVRVDLKTTMVYIPTSCLPQHHVFDRGRRGELSARTVHACISRSLVARQSMCICYTRRWLQWKYTLLMRPPQNN